MVIPSSIGAIATPQLLSHKGYYGEFGDHFMPEIFHETLEAVTVAYQAMGALDVEQLFVRSNYCQLRSCLLGEVGV